MAYKVIILYQLYMPSYFLGTFTEYPQEKRQLRDYAVTVDSVERLTNIDFFPQLSDTLENRLEAAVNYDSWR